MSLDIVRLLESVIHQKGSDLLLGVGERPLVRVGGVLKPLDTVVITAELSSAMMRSITPDSLQTRLSERGSVDFSFEVKKARFRVSVTRVRGNLTLVLRRLPHRLLSIEEIGVPEAIVRLSHRARGLILVTGATGSGKSTTLASLVNRLAQIGGKHIITIEEPTEYIIPHGKGLVTQREVPIDTPSFSQGLIDALRMTPNVIVVGEMRDLETMRAAVTAAETGHLVFGTLHTNDAAGTINRIIDGFPGNEKEELRAKLSVSLIGVLCQTLLPRLDDGGQVAAFETLVVTPAVAHMIRQGETNRIASTIQTGAKYGMFLLDESLYRLVANGTVAPEKALEVANNPEELATKLRRLKRDEEG